MSSTMPLIAVLLFATCMVFATFCDLLTMTIPNRVILALVAGFLVLAPFMGLSLVDAGWHAAAAAIALVVCFSFFAFGWMGGGDAKLIAATTLWLGPTLALPYVLLAAVLGGVLTVLIILARGNPVFVPARLHSQQWIGRLLEPKNGVPYGAALGPAALWILPQSLWGVAAGF